MSSFYFVVKSTVQTLVLVTRDSGALIICTFLYFVHASHTLMLFYMKMLFTVLL